MNHKDFNAHRDMSTLAHRHAHAWRNQARQVRLYQPNRPKVALARIDWRYVGKLGLSVCGITAIILAVLWIGAALALYIG